MMNPTVLKHGGWLTLALVSVIGVFAFSSCRDFDTAYKECVDAGTCIPDDLFLPDGGITKRAYFGSRLHRMCRSSMLRYGRAKTYAKNPFFCATSKVWGTASNCFATRAS